MAPKKATTKAAPRPRATAPLISQQRTQLREARSLDELNAALNTRDVLAPEDQFNAYHKMRSTLPKVQNGRVPSLVLRDRGLEVMTLEVPAQGEAKLWHNLRHQLQIATGVVVLRGLGQTTWDEEIHRHMQDMWCEVVEIVDSRPHLILINVAKGDVRSAMMCFPGMSTISLCEPDATFGMPDTRVGGNPAVIVCALQRRIKVKADLDQLVQKGQPIDAYEAQRIGLVDFVGDVEAEVARLIWRLCQPKTEIVSWRPMLDEGAMQQMRKLEEMKDAEEQAT